jgi:hypothetical protein
MHFMRPLLVLATVLTSTTAQNGLEPPKMTLLYSMACDLGKAFSMGSVPAGKERIAIPIIGGTFKGPRISGKAHYIRGSRLL